MDLSEKRIEEQIEKHLDRQKQLSAEIASVEQNLIKCQSAQERLAENGTKTTEKLDESRKNVEALAAAIHQAELGRNKELRPAAPPPSLG